MRGLCPFVSTAICAAALSTSLAYAASETYWVGILKVNEYDRPEGRIISEGYYGERMPAYQRINGWIRINPTTAETGLWVRASQLQRAEPPPKPKYHGDHAVLDARIAPYAIASPGENGLTRGDVDILHRAAKLVLAARPDCLKITYADKDLDHPGRYYVACDTTSIPFNLFFRRSDVLRGHLP